MPRVPILEPSVPTQAPTIPQPQILRPPEEAFGGDVAKARAGVGSQVQRIAQIGAQRLIELQQRDDEKAALDTVTRFQQDLQQKLLDPEVGADGRPNGFLVRQLAHANGSTPEFDAAVGELKSQYMNTVKAPELQLQVAKVIDAHVMSAREQVIRNEATERQKDYENSLNANINSNVAAAAGISDPRDLVNMVRAAQAQATGGYAHLGHDETSVLYNNKVIAGAMATSAIDAIYDQNPRQAQRLLIGIRPMINPDVAAKIQNTIYGKMLDEKQLSVWNVVQNFKLSDGNIDKTRVAQYVMNMKDVDGKELPANDRKQILSFTHAMADSTDVNFKQQQVAAERSFVNDVITAQSKGIPYDQALKLSAKYAWDTASMANMQDEITKLYANPEDRWNSWLPRQPQSTQSAWKEGELAIRAKYPASAVGDVGGVRQSLQQAAIDEMKQECLGKSGDQIRDLVKQKLDKVVVGPYSFLGMNLPINKTAPGWQIDANDRASLAAANTLLEKTYGADRVGRVKTRLIQGGFAVTPANIKRILDTIVTTSTDRL